MIKNGPFRAHQKIIMLHLGFLNCGILIFMDDWCQENWQTVIPMVQN